MSRACGRCNFNISPRSKVLKCGVCKIRFHVDCLVELSLEDVAFFIEASKNNGSSAKWKCEACTPAARNSPIQRAGRASLSAQPTISTPFTADYNDRLIDSIRTIFREEFLPLLKLEIQNSIEVVNKKLNNRLTALEESHSVLESRINSIEKSLKSPEFRIQNNVSTGNSNELNIFSELEERNKRKNNLMIYNVDEFKSLTPNDRQEKELALIKSVLNPLDIDLQPIKFFRIGTLNSKQKCRPIKMILNNNEIVRRVISKTRNLRDNPIKFSFDKTKNQRDEFLQAKKEMQDRRLNGEEDLIIKYVSGVPKVMKTSKVSPRATSTVQKN